MPDIVGAVLFFLATALIILGASHATGLLLSTLFFSRRLEGPYVLVVGFGTFPALLALGSIVGLWNIQIVPVLAGASFAIYGLWSCVIFCRRVSWRHALSMWRLYSVPAAVLFLSFAQKATYLFGNVVFGDGTRSVMFTVSLAVNHLKPAYPLNFALPVIYPYYLFEHSAFAYAAFAGWLYPSIPLLATELAAVVCFYLLLWLIVQKLNPENAPSRFFITSIIVSSAGFLPVIEVLRHFGILAMQSRIDGLGRFAAFLQTGNHYILGVFFGLLGGLCFFRSLTDDDRKDWVLSVFLLCLSFGFSGIPAAWIAFWIVLLTCLALWQKGVGISGVVLRHLPATVCVGVICMLPVLSNILPRVSSTFYFSAPHFWFAYDFSPSAEFFSLLGEPFFLMLWKGVVFRLAMLLTVFGALAFSAFWYSLLFIRKAEHRLTHPALYALALVSPVSIFLLTFTNTISADWFHRGILVPLVASSIVAGELCYQLFMGRNKMVRFVLVTLIGIQVFGAVRETLPWAWEKPDPLLADINATVPFDAVIYAPVFHDYEKSLRAGRALLSLPTINFVAYLPSSTVLEKLHIPLQDNIFQPCGSTWYGSNSPGGVFMLPANPTESSQQWQKIPCNNDPL